MKNRQLAVQLFLGLCLLVSGLAVLFQQVTPTRAQFSAAGLWILPAGVGGTANAVILAIPNIGQMEDVRGVPIRFIPTSNNLAGATTVEINALGNETVKRISGASLAPIAGSDFSTAAFAEIVWDGTEFLQRNPATGDAPVGSEASFTNTVPAGYLVEDGACISTTTYAALYAFFGSTDLWLTQAGGVACSAGNFHVPLSNGRFAVAANNQGSGTGPLTVCAAGITNNCGAQTLAQNQLPNVIPTFSGSTQTWSTTQSDVVQGTNATGQSGSGPTLVGVNSFASTALTTTITPSGTISSINGGVSQQPFAPPNYQVFKAVKY